MNIVPLRPQHVRLLMAHEKELFGPEAWSRSAYLAEIADVRHRHYVAAESDEGELLGWAGVRVLGDEAEILTVGVVSAARRKGIARRLVADLLEHARARGAAVAFLEVREDNAAARALYESEGFVRIGTRRGYYEHGRVDAVTMRRMIDP